MAAAGIFPKVGKAKMKEGSFVNPQIRLMNDKGFHSVF